MTETADQQTLDLGDYRGRNITDTSVKILNQTGGFHPQTEMQEPRIFEIDEELTIAARVKVTDHHHKRVLAKSDDDPEKLLLIQTLVMGVVAVIPDTGTVKKALDTVAAQRAREVAVAAEKKGAKVKRGHLRSVGSSIEEALQHAESVDADPPPEVAGE